jgi:hypothetical protein
MANEVKELPSVGLRREIEELKARIRLLETAQGSRARVDMIMVEKYNELKNLLERTLVLLAKKEAEWEIIVRELSAKKDA